MPWGSGSHVCTLRVPSRTGTNAWMLAPVGAGYHGWEGPDSMGVGWCGVQTMGRAWLAQERQRRTLRRAANSLLLLAALGKLTSIPEP